MNKHIAVHILKDEQFGSAVLVKVDEQIESRFPIPITENKENVLTEEVKTLNTAKARAFDLAYTYSKAGHTVTFEYINFYDLPLHVGKQETLEMSYGNLHAAVYMGHVFLDAAGKKVTWQKLRELEGKYPHKKLKVTVDRSSANVVFAVIPVPIPAHD